MGKCYNKIEIDSSIDSVWKTISDFHDLSWAPGVITSVKKNGDTNGDKVGAKRLLNNVFSETLIELKPEEFRFSYSIDDGPGPVGSNAVSDYVGVVQLSGNEEHCLVEWSSTFESENESEVSDFCNPIYMALLNALKETLS